MSKSKVVTGKEIFARRLRAARALTQLSQRKLGIEAGMDEFTASVRVNQYEQAVHMPDYATAVSLAAALGVPTAYLYSDDDLIAELLLSAGGLGTKARKALIAQLQSDREP